MASEWECKCKPRCAGLSECHAPQRVAPRCVDCGEPLGVEGDLCLECALASDPGPYDTRAESALEV